MIKVYKQAGECKESINATFEAIRVLETILLKTKADRDTIYDTIQKLKESNIPNSNVYKCLYMELDKRDSSIEEYTNVLSILRRNQCIIESKKRTFKEDVNIQILNNELVESRVKIRCNPIKYCIHNRCYFLILTNLNDGLDIIRVDEHLKERVVKSLLEVTCLYGTISYFTDMICQYVYNETGFIY